MCERGGGGQQGKVVRRAGERRHWEKLKLRESSCVGPLGFRALKPPIRPQITR